MAEINTAEIGGFQFLDFAVAGPRKSGKVVAEQKRLYLEPQGPAWVYYGELYAGLRRAVNAPDPACVLDTVVDRAAAVDEARGRAYAEAREGFLRLLPRGASGVPVKTPTWTEGDLTIVMRRMIGLRQRNGTLLYVAPYVKAAPLTQDGADVLLSLMDDLVGTALPGAVPQVWDVRQGEPFKLRRNTNRAALRCHVRGLAAAYMTAWNIAA